MSMMATTWNRTSAFLAAPCSDATWEISVIYLVVADNRHDDLALRGPVACNMARKRFDVWNQLGLFRRGRGPAHAPPEPDGLACDLSVT